MSWLELKVPPPVWAILIALLMALVDWLWPATSVALPLRYPVAVALVVLGLSFDFPAIMTFVRARTTIWPIDPTKTSALVTTGLYSVTRNPMYLGLVFILLGVMWWLENPLTIVGAPLFMVLLTRFQIIPEERILEDKFGDTYRTYKRQVRRWL